MQSTLTRLILPSLLAVLVSTSSSQNCFASDSVDSTSIELLPKNKIKSAPRKVEIYQYDESPIGDRKPLLFVHGLLGEYHPMFRWKELGEYLCEKPDFQKQYKIYLSRFNTSLSLTEITDEFRTSLRNHFPSGDVTIVAISLAGTVVRNSMKDPSVNNLVSRVITLGSFFRGSPLFCADWMRQTMKKRYPSPLSKIDHLLGYSIYFARHKNLQRDFAWDNSDGQMPPQKKSRHKKALIVTVTDQEQKAIDHKFFVYAGYLHNQYAPREHGVIRKFITTPYSFFKTTLPMHLDREHPALRFLNDLIAKSVPKTSPANDIIYPLNDGISPIASSLLLTNEFAARPDINKMNDLTLIKLNTNAGKARLLDNIDHLTFIERKRPIGYSEKITDMLSSTEEPRAMFEWISKDLME